MLNNIKALVVILAIAWIVFRLARPLCLRFMSAESFARRRNVWFGMTIVGFISPAFWVYALFAIVVLSWAGARDENPLALYLFVAYVVPDARFFIPTFLINQLFDLTQFRLLSLVVLLPAMIRKWNGPSQSGESGLRLADCFLLAFLALQVALQLPYESVTASMRRSFLLFIDTFIVFYAFSRVSDRHRLGELLACFWLSCALMAPVAIFEWAKGWHLYTGLSSMWGDPNVFAYIFRGGGLRSQASVGHSIGLGYALSISLGFFLYLRSRYPLRRFDWMVIGVLSMAIYTTGSRGCWVMSMLLSAAFVMLRPGAARKLGSALAIGMFIFAGMYFTPLKEAVIDKLPIVGTSDQNTVEYRQQLWETAMPLIRQNPLFGDPFVARNMESLRQGQGIIDIVNGYLFTALFYGLVGLFLQMGALTLSLWKAGGTLLQLRAHDADAGLLGASLVAVFVGTLFFIATAGFGTTTYMLAGLLLSYSRCMQGALSPRAASVVAQPMRRGMA